MPAGPGPEPEQQSSAPGGDDAALAMLVDQAVDSGQLAAETADRVRLWLSDAAYADFASQVGQLVSDQSFERLTDLFWEEIPFGTGGRRGVMGPLGTATINARTMAESAHGLACHLAECGITTGRIAVAHDTRHRSREFARLVASTMAAHHFDVLLFDGHRATPTLSFAVRQLDCVAGIVISASHNPPTDNGFKAYWSHGGQVLPPHDQGIIDAVRHSRVIPTCDLDQAISDGTVTAPGPELDLLHQQAILETRVLDHLDLGLDPGRLRGLYTPLCGVGAVSVMPVLRQAGFDAIELFAPQADPDPDFLAVPDQLPNPERPEVFGPAIKRAQQQDCLLVMATDPDADRLAAAAPDLDGSWDVLTGNQLAVILLDHLLRHGSWPKDGYVLTTLVTTPLLRVICETNGLEIADDLLVGFKNIAREIEARGPERFVMGCEESIGYQVGTYGRDKDAGVAALHTADIALELAEQSETLWHRLAEIYDRYGRIEEFQHAIYTTGSTGREDIQAAMHTLRHDPPAAMGQVEWHRVRDYGSHEIRLLPSNEVESALPTPDSNLLVFESEAHDGVLTSLAVRPSGTEPKIKFYGFCRQRVPGTGDVVGGIQHLTSGLMDCLNQLFSRS